MFAFILLAGVVIKDMVNLLAEGQLTLGHAFRLISLLFPYVFVYALPLGVLTGVLLTMGRLSSQSEITAMRAAGISVFRIASAVVFFAVVGVAGSLAVNFYFGPKAKTEYRRELANIVQSNPLGFMVEKTFVKSFPGFVIYVSRKDGDKVYDLWVWELSDEKRVKRFHRGQSGFFTFHDEQNALNLVLENAFSELRDKEDLENFKSQKLISPSYGSTGLLLPLDRILGRATFNKKLTWMSYNELLTEKAKYENELSIAKTPEEKESVREKLMQTKMVFHDKFARGFSTLSLAILGVPLGIRVSRKETSANLFVALGLALAYYVMMMGIGWMDPLSEAKPHLLYWVPNLLFQGIGLFMLFRADRGLKVRET